MVDKVSGVPLVNPVTAQIPNFVLQQLQAQRNQQLAQTLQTQGMSPIDYDPHGRISWTQGLAKALQTGAGLALGNDAMSQQAGLQQQGMQAMAPMYGFGTQPSPQALAAAINPADASHAALAQGAQQGSVGPTNSNAALMTALAGNAQPPASSAPTSAAPMNPFGAPPMLAYAASNGDPAALEQLKTFGANATSTPEMKNNSAFGISPEMARSMAISKASNEGFHAFTPGETWTNTFTGQGGYAPKLPDNAQPNAPFTPGSPIPSVGVVPGAQGVAQGNAQSGATGATAGGVHTITNPDGSSSTGLGSDLFNIPPAVQAGRDSDALTILRQERAKPTNSPEDNAALDREIALAGRTHTTTSPNASFAPMVAQGSKLVSDAQLAQQGNQSSYAALDEMERLLKSGAKFGPGTAGIAHFKALANNYVPGIDLTGAQTNQDVMHKLASTLAGSQSPRSDADLANWQARYPSGELTNQASAELIPILRRNAQVVDARANVMTRNVDDGLQKLPDLANRFNQIASPGIVSDGKALADASRAGPQAVQQFISQYKATHSDWQQRLQSIQKLDEMKAF